MNKSQNALPLEIMEVGMAYEVYLKSESAYTLYTNRFYRALDLYDKSEEPVVQQELTKYWLKHFHHWIDKDGVNELIVKEMDRFIGFVARHDLTSKYFNEPQDALLLGALCVARINLRDSGMPHPKEYNVAQLLQQWSGQCVPEDTTRSIEKAVSFIYGPACWALCRDDVVFDYEMPKYIWDKKIPISVGTKNNKQTPPEDLPTNLTT